MKRILSVLAVMLLVAVAAQAAEVKSANVAGVINVTIPGSNGLQLVGINLDAFEAADANLEGVFGGQLRGGAFPDSADKIIMWDTGSSQYTTYAKKNDGKFYDVTAGLANWFSGTSSNPSITAGMAFWVQSPAGVGDLNVSFSGQAVEASTIDTSVVSGLQFLSYPLSVDVGIQDLAFTSQGTGGPFPDSADKILVWQGSSYKTFALKNDGKFYDVTAGLANWFSGTAATDVINLGQGFWYDAQSGFTWQESNPYVANL